jgi:iron complex outermembrane receptor protein
MMQRTLRTVAAFVGALSYAVVAGAVPEERASHEHQGSFDTITVTATKLPEELGTIPAMLSTVTGEELRARGVQDLRAALSLLAGVDVSPGGDAGPAGSVPALWGLQEFDAFLLVVDGVPWGGAFNPAVVTLDLTNVQRIEVLRGAAPVSFGATSFVGVIHVIHYAPGETPGRATAEIGDRDTYRASLSFDLPPASLIKHSLTINGETRQFSQDDSNVQRFHALYRAAADLSLGRIHLDLDGVVLRQDPYSPHPRAGASLSANFPLDANVNPSNAKQDQDRFQVNIGFDKVLGTVDWVTLYSFSYTDGRNVRGFLREPPPNRSTPTTADGFAQDIDTIDMYFDTYLSMRPVESVRVLVGADWLYGDGTQESENFEYEVLPNGSNRPRSSALHVDEFTRLKDRRHFVGVYSVADWRPSERWDVTAGMRLNATLEEREGRVIETTEGDGSPETRSDRRHTLRPSVMVGASYALWMSKLDRFSVFANYRNTYKPAAVDFGPEAEGEILKPETADSWEVGFRGRLREDRLEWTASYFHMDFDNLVIAENVKGLPALANAGQEEFQGVEFEGNYRIVDALTFAASYAYHRSKFTDFERLQGDGTRQQLAGNYLELSPKHLASTGFVFAPADGLRGSVVWRYIGERFLNKSNTAKAGAFQTVDAGVGYRFGSWTLPVTLRIDGVNLTDNHDPVAESELGDAQFYRMPGRTVLGSIALEF